MPLSRSSSVIRFTGIGLWVSGDTMDRFISMSSFVQVVDGKSFSRAARQLKLSQATVTGHVQSLEQQLGVRLLNRTTRKVSLTEEGAQFYQRCIRILAEVAEVENLATSFQQAPRGSLIAGDFRTHLRITKCNPKRHNAALT